MFTSFVTAFAAGLLATASSVQAQDTTNAFKLLQPTVFGSGCVADSSYAQVSPDGQTISILLSQYGAMTNETENRVRQSCNFVVPVEAVPGRSIGLYRIDFRGWAYVPNTPGAYGRFNNMYFFAGQQGPVVNTNYGPGTDEAIYSSTQFEVQSVIWSPCGGSSLFRINSALTAYRSVIDMEQVQMQVDTVDATVSGNVQLGVKVRDCSPTAAPTLAPTPAPTTLAPTPVPTTKAPTPAPTTLTPTPTMKAVAPVSTTTAPAPTTPAPTTPAPTTPESTTPQPTTPAPTTPEAKTPASTTPEPTTLSSTTPAPTTPTSTTPEPTTPAPTTPASTTPAPTTPASTTPEPSTPAPTTPAASTPVVPSNASTLDAASSPGTVGPSF